MSNTASLVGIALTCNDKGIIQTLLLDGMGITGLKVARSLESSVEESSRTKLRNFLVELRRQGSAVGWEVNVVKGDTLVTIQISGVCQKDLMLILGYQDVKETSALCDQFIKIDKEQANLLRAAIKENIQNAANQADPANSLFDEISRLNNELINLQRELAQKNAQLERLNQQVRELSLTDSLTGLYNRRGFFELGGELFALAKRYNRPLTAVMFDIDKFKTINDTHGHIVGDHVITQMAQRCRSELRKVDLLGHYGGDEFSILFPETTTAGALQVAERLRLAVLAPFQVENHSVNIAVSIGIGEISEAFTDLEKLLQAADSALYQAKARGGNCICIEHGCA